MKTFAEVVFEMDAHLADTIDLAEFAPGALDEYDLKILASMIKKLGGKLRERANGENSP